MSTHAGREPTRDTVVLEETTVATLHGVRVGVANIWEREYTSADGAVHTGLAAWLHLDDGRALNVGPGSVAEVGAARYEVVAVNRQPDDERGEVRLRELIEP